MWARRSLGSARTLYVRERNSRGLTSLLLRKQERWRRAELRLECASVRRAARLLQGVDLEGLRARARQHARRAFAPRWATRFSLEFAALDTRLNIRLSRWGSSFVCAPTGRNARVRELCSNVV